jgi:hypothetical protein
MAPEAMAENSHRAIRSSECRLQAFPFDKINIDRSFISNVGTIVLEQGMRPRGEGVCERDRATARFVPPANH